MNNISNTIDLTDIYFETSEIAPIPKLTTLYGLQPYGIGTRNCESLRSYILRLADAHRISAKAIWEVICDNLGNDSRLNNTRAAFMNKPNYYATGVWTNNLITVLSEMTSVDSLSSCTMLPIQNVVGTKSLISLKVRHCPLCLKEAIQSFKPYGQLIWEVACVTACPTHGVQLVNSECGANAESKLSHFRKKLLSGVCVKCGSIGYSCRREEAIASPDIEIWKSQQVADIIAHFPVTPQMFSNKNIIIGLNSIIDMIADGKPAIAARLSGINKSVLWTWVNGKHHPTLELLLDLCMTAGVSLLSTMLGNPKSIDSPIHPKKHKKNLTQKPTLEERENCLKEALLVDTPPSLGALGRKIGIDRSMLSRQFKELSALVINRHKQFSLKQRNDRNKEEKEFALKLITELKTKGLPLTQRNLQATYGNIVLPNTQMYLAFREIRAGTGR